VPRSSPFTVPAQPTPRHRPPKGEQWLHEVKFDGYRVQLHKAGEDVVIYSRTTVNAVSWALGYLGTGSSSPAKPAIPQPPLPLARGEAQGALMLVRTANAY
jgi:ATP dependent DNA ligase domain